VYQIATKLPNGQKIPQMAKYTPNGQIYPKLPEYWDWDFWFENIPSGNPGLKGYLQNPT
jgi:hypothetical protein